MEIAERLKSLREELLEQREREQHVYVRLFAALDVAEEAVREANRELRQRKQNIRTEQEVAKELGCCVATVRSARKRHHVPHIVAGRLVRYTDEQFERLLQAMERPKLREAKPGSRAA